jgi:hypothetical protein
VSKLHVLGLRTIVTEVGADRGILLCEKGFQSGAIEAARLTNVHVTTLENLKVGESQDIHAMRLRELFDRVETCRKKYWDIPKDTRIERGLRADVGEWGYSGASVIELLDELLRQAFRGQYPITVDSLSAIVVERFEQPIATPNQLVAVVEKLLTDLEQRLEA